MRVVILVLMICSSMLAHKLHILANDDGERLHVKSYFTKSSTCKDCEVRIYQNGKLIESGKTDESGTIEFLLSAKSIDIEVVASMGHKNRISYNSEGRLVAQNKHISIRKIFLALVLIALFFFLLRVYKR